jgi:hypothetical protein
MIKMEIPILLLIYNRYGETKKLIKALEKIKPNKIYIAADGPKYKNNDDFIKCKKVRKLFDRINWKCEVYKKYNKHNLGCKISVSESINWFFSKVSEGIILEDDCIPNKDFFKFCEILLKKYRNNKRVFCISGSNYYANIQNKPSYYFSKYIHCWGWATWKRAWKHNNIDINFWPKFKKNSFWNKLHPVTLERLYWEKIMNNMYKNKIDSWAYSWLLSVWKKNGLTAVPKNNLITNIGLGKNSLNSFFRKKKDIYKSYAIDKVIRHPRIFSSDSQYDSQVFYTHYKPFNYLYPWRIGYLLLMFFKNPILFLKKAKNTIL